MRKANKTPHSANGDRSVPLGAVGCEGMKSSAKRRQPRLPKMGRHSSGQARVTIQGKVHYLGAHGSPEAHARYAELVKRWLAGERVAERAPHSGQAVLTVRDLFSQYRDWIALTGRYTKNGASTSHRTFIENVLVAFEAFAGRMRGAAAVEYFRSRSMSS